MLIKRPLKARSESITNEELKRIKFPLWGSPKIDGIRCCIDTVPLTSSMKLQPNVFISEELSKPELNGLDGELAGLS